MNPESVNQSVADACIAMAAGEVVSIDADVLAELKRHRYIRKPRKDDAIAEGVEFVVSKRGEEFADAVLKLRTKAEL